jgi:hypothetical protein
MTRIPFALSRATREAPRMALVACPFCREMFEEGEETTCPLCGVALTEFVRLPPSASAEAHDEFDIPIEPDREMLPVTYMGRMKGLLVAFGGAGLGLFFLPWIRMSLPYELAMTGFDLAHGRLGWVWAAGVAWFVLLPTVLSRRSIFQMRGARVAAAFLSAIPGLTAAILLARPPHGGLVPLRFTYDWPIWATLVVSIAAIFAALRLGGRVDDIKVSRGTSKGQSLH